MTATQMAGRCKHAKVSTTHNVEDDLARFVRLTMRLQQGGASGGVSEAITSLVIGLTKHVKCFCSAVTPQGTLRTKTNWRQLIVWCSQFKVHRGYVLKWVERSRMK